MRLDIQHTVLLLTGLNKGVHWESDLEFKVEIEFPMFMLLS